MNHWYDILYEESLHMPVVNTHCHHLPDSYFSSTVTLNALLGSSYLSQEWCRMPYQDRAQRSAFLDALRFNSYFIYFSRALQALYAPGVPLTEDTWDEYSALSLIHIYCRQNRRGRVPRRSVGGVSHG